jgi:hypothetical protein
VVVVENEVWIVGQQRPELDHRWELCGIYTSKAKAVAACLDASYFVGKVPLNKPAPDESTEFPESQYPRGDR